MKPLSSAVFNMEMTREEKAERKMEYRARQRLRDNLVGGVDGQKHNKVNVRFLKEKVEVESQEMREKREKEMINEWLKNNEVTRVA